MDYAFNVPLNSLSFGNVSIALLREAYKAGHQPSIFPIGNQVDISAQREDKDFNVWLDSCIKKSFKVHKKSNPSIKLWHLNGGLESVSNKQVLFTFYETDQPSPEELNVIANNNKVIVTNDYIANVFKEYGCENVTKIPLGFDSYNFKRTNKQYFTDGRITFNVTGKYEKRKCHAKIIQAWLKKYGNNPKYFLNCALWNHFIPPEQQKQIFSSIINFDGRKYGNVQFLGFMPNNAMYNDYLCAGDITIGMSGGEGYDLPVFQCLGLGLHGVVLNAHAYKEYANSENAVLVNPNGKEPCYDGVFFNPGGPWNNGNFYTWDEEAFIYACEKAIERVKENKVNVKGMEIQEKFTYKQTFDKLYQELEKI